MTTFPSDFLANAVYTVNFILLFSCLLDRNSKRADQRVALVLLRIVILIPLLAAQYGFSNHYPNDRWVAPLFFSENLLAFFLVVLALRLQGILNPGQSLSRGFQWAVATMAVVLSAIGAGWWLRPPAVLIEQGALVVQSYGPLYFSSFFTLLATLVMAWRLEIFWRVLTNRYRWQYKYLVLGFLLIFGCLVWSVSYRLTYLDLPDQHRSLLSVLMITAWVLIIHALARHRLLNRQVFISRKVVYSAILPTAFGFYLIGLGLISLLIKTIGWTLPFVLKWMLIILGLLLVIVLGLVRKLRDRVKYFISTHFYLNKYEYRDVWLAFSKLLHEAVSEKDVAAALGQILSECLYTRTILIWLGDRGNGFRLVEKMNPPADQLTTTIAPDDPLVAYLQLDRCLYTASAQHDPVVKTLIEERASFFKANDIVLMAALLVGEQCVGVIGLGPEYTGGRYGRDDFDLLTTLGSQAASALLAARNAERLAHAREQSAWGILSAFVMHDIKNAATMLGLVQQNAPQHMHDPEFQKDLLITIDDALRRMTKVQTRLSILKGEITPVRSMVDLEPFLQDSSAGLCKKIPGLTLKVRCPQTLRLQTDQEFLYHILENLLLNAWEAGGAVSVTLAADLVSEDLIQIRFHDTGPGIPLEMLPTRLFDPFATSKPKGTGIGLWQVRQLVEALGGSITAENSVDGGACFTLLLPSGV